MLSDCGGGGGGSVNIFDTTMKRRHCLWLLLILPQGCLVWSSYDNKKVVVDRCVHSIEDRFFPYLYCIDCGVVESQAMAFIVSHQ